MHHAQNFARVLKELKEEPVLRSPKGAQRYAADNISLLNILESLATPRKSERGWDGEIFAFHSN